MPLSASYNTGRFADQRIDTCTDQLSTTSNAAQDKERASDDLAHIEHDTHAVSNGHPKLSTTPSLLSCIMNVKYGSDSLQVVRVLCLVVTICFGPGALIAQQEAPPTLSLGLDEILFRRGTIDTEILSEMIATKQEELAREILRKGMLSTIKNESFALNFFMEQALEDLLHMRQRRSLEKNLLENSANLALVHGFTELMVHLTLADPESKLNKLAKDTLFATRYSANAAENGVLIRTALLRRVQKDRARDTLYLSEILIDMVFDICLKNDDIQKKGFFNLPLDRTNETYTNNSSYHRFLRSTGLEGTKALLADLRKDYEKTFAVFFKYHDFIREHQILTVNDLESVKKNYLQTDLLRRTMLNSVLKENGEEIAELHDRMSQAAADIAEKDIALAEAMNRLADLPLQGLVDTVEFKRQLRELEQGVKSADEALNTAAATMTKLRSMAFMRKHQWSEEIPSELSIVIVKYREHLKELLLNHSQLGTSNEFSQLYRTALTLSDATRPFDRARYARFANDSLMLDVLRIAPLLTEVELERTLDLTKLLSLMLFNAEFEDLSKDLGALPEIKGAIALGSNNLPLRRFLEFIMKLSELDEPETYSYLFTILNDLGNITRSAKASQVVNVVVNNIGKFTMYDEEQRTMKVDVEGVILEIAERYTTSNNGRFEVLLNIGLNQGFFLRDGGYTISETDRITNLSFASEKIGFILKFCDFERQRRDAIAKVSESPIKDWSDFQFQRKPSVRNLHVLAYGSGLLYNLADMKTSTTFNAALGGVGVGISFFNSLDCTASLAHAFTPDRGIALDNTMISFGFDVRLSEYIKKVREKRMAKDEADRQRQDTAD